MELLGFFSLTSFAALPIVLLVPTVMYLLESVALMRIARKLGLKGAWRAFVPVFNCHLMGKMAEQDDKRNRPEKKGKRWGRIALWLNILLLFFSTLSGVLLALLAWFTGYSGTEGDTPAIVAGSLGLVLIGVLAYLAFFTLVLVLCIVMWVILYKIYHVMVGDHAVWMMVLSIFFGLATPVILVVLAYNGKFPLTDPANQPALAELTDTVAVAEYAEEQEKEQEEEENLSEEEVQNIEEETDEEETDEEVTE